MKKGLLLFVALPLIVSLFSCAPSPKPENISEEKYNIVSEKYGDLEYIDEGLIIYKNLAPDFPDINGLTYILENSGDRGSVSHELSENFYVLLDVVKHKEEYKILVYNNIMKPSADKSKMFVLTDYFLPKKIEDIQTSLDYYKISQDIKDFKIMFIKKDRHLVGNITNTDILSTSFYKKRAENSIILSFHDSQSGNTYIASEYSMWIGNIHEQKIYYPTTLAYVDAVKTTYDTLEDEKIDFSLDKGETFNNVNNYLENFDIWAQAINSEVSAAVFFYAFTYEEFITKATEAKNPNSLPYVYLKDQSFDRLIATYDQAFFDDNILLYYYKYEPNISKNYVYSVTKKGNTLTLNINRFEGMSTALSQWEDIVTIKKDDVKGINKVDLIVRTISELQTRVSAYISDAYAREFYLNPLTMDDFKGIDNLKAIDVFYWSLNVYLIFNKPISDADLARIVTNLENNPHLKSIGYVGKDKIIMQLKEKYYDAVVNKTLKVTDIIELTLINDFSLSIFVPDFIPFLTVTFILEVPGKENALKMIDDLNNLNYPFLEIDSYSSIYIIIGERIRKMYSI